MCGDLGIADLHGLTRWELKLFKSCHPLGQEVSITTRWGRLARWRLMEQRQDPRCGSTRPQAFNGSNFKISRGGRLANRVGV